MRRTILLSAALSIGCVTFRNSPPITIIGNNNTTTVTINEAAPVEEKTIVEKKVYAETPSRVISHSVVKEQPRPQEYGKMATFIAGGVGIISSIIAWNEADFKHQTDQKIGPTIGLVISSAVFLSFPFN